MTRFHDEPVSQDPREEVEHAIRFYGTMPACFDSRSRDCYDCPLEFAHPCPVRVDADYRSLLEAYEEGYRVAQRRRIQQIRILTTILQRQGLRMHWEYLAVLAMQEAPAGLFPSEHSIRAVLIGNPETFRMEMDGVFNLVKRRARG